MRTKEQNAAKMRRYRAKHKERYNAYNRAYYKLHKAEKRRLEHMAGKKCKLCGIALTSISGGYGTKVHCYACAMMKKQVHKFYMREYRKRLSHAIIS